MDFGGYVAYTVGGFKCHAFGTPAIKDIINTAASELDMPQSLSLRPARSGFRRNVLKSPASQIVVYTAFVGLSEPTVNRLGSFLAIGIATQQDVDCTANNVGHSLYNLLADLVGRVSDGNKFTSELSIDVFNAFLRDNSPLLEELHTGSSPSGRALGSRTEQGIVFLSEENISLTTVYNRVCKYVPPGTDFFLFESVATAEVQGARHDFRVASWPVRAAQADIRSASAGTVKPHKGQAGEVPQQTLASAQSDSDRLKSLERLVEQLDERHHQRIGVLEEALGFWKLVGMIVTGVLAFLFVLTLYLARAWNSDTDERLAAIRNQVRGIQGYARDTQTPLAPERQETNPPKAPAPAPAPAPSVGSEGRAVRLIPITTAMTLDQVKKEHCSAFPPSKSFTNEFKQLNPNGLDNKGKVKPGSISLPIECAR